jgi:Putative DNA-binding domain
MPFSPFKKSLRESLAPEDLQVLIADSVAEGYFVEYKSILPAPNKIAKSIASFANTYGGWYIVGVTTDGHNVAQRVAGFSLDDRHDPIASVRDSIRSGIDPVPVFFPQVVTLAPKLVVLVVYVPSEQDTPFITKDGRIYRRVSDSSEPVPETQRSAVDRLVEQGRDHARAFQLFCQDPRTFSDSEASTPWVNIFLSPYPLGMVERFELTSQDGLERLLKRSRETIPLIRAGDEEPPLLGKIPFQQARAMLNSVFLKQINSNAHQTTQNSLSMELFDDGRARFFIPLRIIKVTNGEIISSEVRSRQVRVILEDHLRQDADLYLANFFDLTSLWQAAFLMANFYLDWVKNDLPLIHNFRVLLHGNRLWRTVAFVDEDRWAEHVRTFHLPIMANNEMKIPEERREGVVINIDESPESLWSALLPLIGLMFGLPTETLRDLVETFKADTINKHGLTK